MKTHRVHHLVGIIVTILCLTLLALAGLGFKSAAGQFEKAFTEWRNPPPANAIELMPTIVHSDGTVSHFILQRNETEIELPNMVVQSSATTSEKE